MDPTSPNLVRTYGAIIPIHKRFVWFLYLAAFSNASGSKLSYIENDAKFRTFLTPPPVKIMGGVSEISMPIVEALLTTEPPKYI